MPTKVDTTTPDEPSAQGVKEAACCERFDPSIYDEKEILWKDKPFVIEKVRCFLYVPINFGAATTRAITKLESADAKPTGDAFVMLSDMKSPWSSKLFVATTKEDVPDANVSHVSGRYITKVFEGPYSNCGKWVKEMEEYLKEEKQVKPKEILAYYTTCPGCAKKYGKNYCVLFAKVE
jgi:hypothetical protein